MGYTLLVIIHHALVIYDPAIRSHPEGDGFAFRVRFHAGFLPHPAMND